MSSFSEMIAQAQLVRSRLEKQAFLPADASGVQQPGMPPGGDPSQMGGAPPEMDPAAMGGMPGGGAPMDPAMMGGDPSMGGGMAPPPPPGLDPAMLEQIASAVAAKMGGGAGGAAAGGGAAGGIKPKIDVNIALMQILKIQARIADSLGIQIPASEMVATQNDLGQMAQQQQAPPTPDQAIQPIAPIDPAGMPPAGGAPPEKTGYDLSHRARATRTMLTRQGFKFE